ncbi:MAG: hypothetical protein V8Q43_01835 [Christensenellaceae bacterium]
MIELERDKQAAQALLQKALGRTDAAEFTRMGGLTNRTYHAVFQDGAEYVVRIPGEGTEEMISRRDEEVSTRLACKLGIDAELLYFGENGAKVTAYIPGAVTMSAPAMRGTAAYPGSSRHSASSAPLGRRHGHSLRGLFNGGKL